MRNSLIFICFICIAISGCTTREEKAAVKTIGGIGSLFGIPEPVGEGIAGSLLAGVSLLFGHAHGVKKAYKKIKKAAAPVPFDVQSPPKDNLDIR